MCAEFYSFRSASQAGAWSGPFTFVCPPDARLLDPTQGAEIDLASAIVKRTREGAFLWQMDLCGGAFGGW